MQKNRLYALMVLFVLGMIMFWFSMAMNKTFQPVNEPVVTIDSSVFVVNDKMLAEVARDKCILIQYVEYTKIGKNTTLDKANELLINYQQSQQFQQCVGRINKFLHDYYGFTYLDPEGDAI